MLNNPELISETINNINKISKEELESVMKAIDIEEDIKIVENLINNCKNSSCEKEKMCNDCYIEIEEIRAIENLLKEYKEKQKIIKMKDGDIEWLQRKIDNHFIDKQVIRDIIDECIPKKQNVITGKKETLYQKALNELVIADKMIDEMSKWISNESCREGFKDSMEEVKEIFRKKVEE